MVVLLLQAGGPVPEGGERSERDVPVLRVHAGGAQGRADEGAGAGLQHQAGGPLRLQPEGPGDRRQDIPGEKCGTGTYVVPLSLIRSHEQCCGS